MDNSNEYILCSAIHVLTGESVVHQPVNIVSGFVVCGFRHHNCITVLATIYSDYYNLKKNNKSCILIQGFLTSKNRFVNRYEAYDIFFKTKDAGKELYSEDLY